MRLPHFELKTNDFQKRQCNETIKLYKNHVEI